MKTKLQRITALATCLGATLANSVLAQPFDAGSTGADGPLNITSNTVLALPTNGIFHFTTIHVAAGTTLTFTRNSLNTPVHLLAVSNVTINGTIDVSGQFGNSTAGGRGGPGGFDGGMPGLDANTPPGAGYGPGAGRGGAQCCGISSAGAGGYSGAGGQTTTNKGAAYGSPLLMPLAGGSGGGGYAGNPGVGGGGGGGAILIASSTRIDINNPGRVLANGSGGCYNDGSGGAIRLLAPLVTGNGTLNAFPGCNGGGSAGRIRVDTTNRRLMTLVSSPVASIGANMASFPNVSSRLDIVEAAGTTIPVGTPAPVSVQLPFGSTSNRTVTVQASDFNAVVPISVVLTPDSGAPLVYQTTIDNLANNPAQTVVNVNVPVNVVVTINAWTR
jgi:hypothetical protein